MIRYDLKDPDAPDIQVGDLIASTRSRWIVTAVHMVKTRDGGRRFMVSTLKLRVDEPDPPGNRFTLRWYPRKRRTAPLRARARFAGTRPV